jgi:hypothetical protein
MAAIKRLSAEEYVVTLNMLNVLLPILSCDVPRKNRQDERTDVVVRKPAASLSYCTSRHIIELSTVTPCMHVPASSGHSAVSHD